MADILYCTVDEVKEAVDKTTDSDDGLIASFIVEAQDAIDDYLNFSFQVSDAVDRTYNGSGVSQQLIERCQSFSCVRTQSYTISTDDSGAYIRTADTPIDITGDVFLGPQNIAPGFMLSRYSGYIFPVGTQNIIVTGIFGGGAVPPRVRRAAKLLTIHYLKIRDANYEDQIGADQFGKPIFRKAMPAEVKELLDRTRRPFFAM